MVKNRETNVFFCALCILTLFSSVAGLNIARRVQAVCDAVEGCQSCRRA